MIDTGDLTMYCHWDKGLVCKKEFYCDTCEHQPAADDKENGKAEPVHIRWAEDYWERQISRMPLLREYAVQLGAVCLLRSKVSARRAYGGMEQAAGGSSHGLPPPAEERARWSGQGRAATDTFTVNVQSVVAW